MIEIRSLTKKFSLHRKTLFDFKNPFLRKKSAKSIIALSEINLFVDQGEVLGVVGRNGAGKSTLLQIICGTLTPSSGTVSVNGKIGALLELGAGFHPDFTGVENINLTASVIGMSKSQIKCSMNEIIEFADIGEYIDRPVRTYSTGMSMRLAFSIATSMNPEILIIDEALSVGDEEFSQKSFNRIMNLKQSGTTILFCSHSMYQIEALCTRALCLQNGKISMIGTPAEVTTHYLENLQNNKNNIELKHLDFRSHVESSTPKIIKIEIKKNNSIQGKNLILRSRRDNLSIKVYFKDLSNHKPSIAFSIRRKSGEIVASCGSKNDGINSLTDSNGRKYYLVEFPKVALLKGNFYMDVSLFCSKGIHTFDHVIQFLTFSVLQDDLEQGICHLNHKWLEFKA
jgi:lipopolysaccharide transport system ATP-binding protein